MQKISKEQINKYNDQFFYKDHFINLNNKVSSVIKNRLENIFILFNSTELSQVVYTLFSEMIINGIKAMHKQLYYKSLIQPLEQNFFPEKLSYAEWLKMFKHELEQNQSKNLNRIAQAEGKYVGITISIFHKGISLKVINPGVPSEIETERIQNIFEKIKTVTSLAYLFDDTDEYKEGGGLGIGLILMTLRGLEVDDTCFKITTKLGMTISSLVLPWSVFKVEIVED